MCGAEVDHDDPHCQVCGHDQFEEIAEEPNPEPEGSSGSEGEQEAVGASDTPHSRIYKDCTFCFYEVHETVSICPACGSDRFGYTHIDPQGNEGHSYTPNEDSDSDIVVGPADPTEGSDDEFDIEVESDPVFCSYLKNDMQMCGAKKPSPCGRHDSDKQKAQETTLKQIMADAFNKMKGTSYSIADVGLPDEASAYEFLCAIFYYLDVNQDRIDYSPYTGQPATAESRHDHRKAECWNQSTYDHSYHCKYCPATSPSPPWMGSSPSLMADLGADATPQLVNYISNHSKLKAASTEPRAIVFGPGEQRPDCYKIGEDGKPHWEHYWIMKYKDEAKTQVKGRHCQYCDIAFTLNPNRDM